MNFTGTTGSDTQSGSAGDDVFNYVQGGHDVLSGLDGDDLFKLGASLDAKDRIDGGTGNDTLSLAGDYSAGVVFAASTIRNIETLRLGSGFDYRFTTANGNVAAGQVMLVDAHTLGAGDTLVFDGHKEKHGGFDIYAGAGADSLIGGAQADAFDLSRGGNDTAIGGGGNDSFVLGAKLTADDQIDGGTGFDTVTLKGASLTLQATTLTGVEELNLLDSAKYKLTMADANVAAGQILVIDASALSGNHKLQFDGSAETDGAFSLIGGAGGDILTGGAGADHFSLGAGGKDHVVGGDGNDVFDFGASLAAGDQVDGGAGIDTLELDGDYSGVHALTLAAAMTAGIEAVKLDGGHSYDLTTLDQDFSGLRVTIDGSALGASDALSFDGSAETDATFSVIGGAGDDTLTCAEQGIFDLSRGGEDTVISRAITVGTSSYLFGATFDSGDVVQGAAGYDILVLDGSYAGGVTLSGLTLTGINQVNLMGGHDLTLVLTNGMADTQPLQITASSFAASDNLTVDLTQDAAASVSILGGAGDDFVSAASDYAAGHLNYNGQDGFDTLSLSGDCSAAFTLNMVRIEKILLAAGFDYHFDLHDYIGAGEATLIDASALGVGDTLTFDGSSVGGSLTIDGGAGADVVKGSQGDDVIDLSKGGGDTVNGGAGDDLISFGGSLNSGDQIDGGDGIDTVTLNGDYTGPHGVFMDADAMKSVERLRVMGGHDYQLTASNGAFSAGQTTIDGGALGASNHLSFDASSDHATSYSMIGGAGDDVLKGGSQAAIFDLSEGGQDSVSGGDGDDVFVFGNTLTTADHIDGGAGYNDEVEISGDHTGSQALTLDAAFMTNVEILKLDPGFSYEIATDDNAVKATESLVVDASDLGSDQHLILDGSQQTDSHFGAIGGAGDDSLIGGHAQDYLTGGGGADTFVFSSAADVGRPDVVTDADFDADSFQFVLAGGAVQGIDAAVTSGTLTDADFRADLAALIGPGQLQAHHAVLVTADAGDLAGHTYLVVDDDGTAGYQDGSDYVVEVTDYTGTLDLGDFG